MDIKDIKDIKDKRQEVACKLRKLAKQEWMSIDIDDIHQMIFGTRLHPTKDTTVAEYDEYDREICSALADLIDTTCDFLPESYAVWYDENDNECGDCTIEDPCNHENAYCSKCGGIMMVGEEGEDGWFTRKKVAHGNELIPNFDYCPYCGCRVRK